VHSSSNNTLKPATAWRTCVLEVQFVHTEMGMYHRDPSNASELATPRVASYHCTRSTSLWLIFSFMKKSTLHPLRYFASDDNKNQSVLVHQGQASKDNFTEGPIFKRRSANDRTRVQVLNCTMAALYEMSSFTFAHSLDATGSYPVIFSLEPC
jgi:hypothetical protein